MKISDILVEAPRGTYVLQSGEDFRVDPNPDHQQDTHPEAWTKDIRNAHVFGTKGARRFQQGREEAMRRSSTIAHKQTKMVPVQLDDEGHPFVPEIRKPSFFDRMRRKEVA